MIQYFPIYLYGTTTIQDVMMDYGKAEECYIRYHQEYQPDFAWGPQAIYPGAAVKEKLKPNCCCGIFGKSIYH